MSTSVVTIITNDLCTALAKMTDAGGMMRRLVDVLSDEQVASLIGTWSGRPIRVATVCSGTDAPVLALELLLAALKEKTTEPTTIEMEHVFSCESTPFKRDFIVRTSKPPLLFKDVTELASGVGECHDGIKREVPESFAMLIAGTECVDFSSLSTTPKGLHENGRSGTTFWATLALTKLRRPSIVILENVAKCPDKEMEVAFEEAGYDAVHCKVCTSDFFLPQSRQRKYFVFVHRNQTRMTGTDWVGLMRRMGSERPAQPTEKVLQWTDFLRSDEEDPATNPTKKRKRRGKPLSASGNTKWLAEINAIETKEGLTPYDEEGGRPYSTATENCPALASLPDRARLRLDVQYKRAVKAGIDPNSTPLLWNPAQQLRFTDAQPWLRTIAPCVTPKHEWIVSSRQAPLTGRECLDLQGMPISDADARWFDDAQLRDLAGNAMSVPVVGATCLAALASFEIVSSNTDENGPEQ